MKKIVFLLTLFVMCLITSCKTGVYTSAGGEDDVAYLFFTSSHLYANEKVEVVLDGKMAFTVKVVKSKKARSKYKGKLYAVQPGQKKLVVKDKKTGKEIYTHLILISTKETKEIKLP